MMNLDSIAAVIDALERAPRIVIPLVQEVPAAIVRRRPSPGRWSAHEHACHLAVVHRLFFERIDLMLASPHPIITPYDPSLTAPDDALLRLELQDSLAWYAQDRARLVTRIRSLTPADWARTADHGEYSHYSVFIMLRHAALHDFLHAYRIEEALLRKSWGDD